MVILACPALVYNEFWWLDTKFTFRAYLITISNVLAYTFVLLRHIEKLCVQHSLAHEMCNDRRSVFELQSFCSAFSCANSCKNVRQNFLFHYQPSDNNFGGAATKAAWTSYMYIYFLVAFSKLLETYKQQDLCPIFGLAITTIVAFPVFFINLLCHSCFCIWSKLSTEGSRLMLLGVALAKNRISKIFILCRQ